MPKPFVLCQLKCHLDASRDESDLIDRYGFRLILPVIGLEQDVPVIQELDLAQVTVLIVSHKHNGPVHRTVRRYRQHDIALVDPEAPHAVIRRQIEKHLVRVGALNPAVFHRYQLIADRLHHRIHHRHPLQYALQPQEIHIRIRLSAEELLSLL